MKFALSVITAVLLASSSLVGAVPIDTQEIERQSAEGLSLLRLGPDVDPVWKTEEEKWELKKASVRFVDVTETWDYFQSNPTPQGAPKDLSVASAFPSPSHQDDVKLLLDTLSIANMKSSLDSLTAFNNRYYTSATGKKASQWIFDKLTSIASGKKGVSVTKFAHSWVQFSVITRINGTTSDPKSPVTILGCHIDSINLNDRENGRAPGADDDGSGTVNSIEIFRALVNSSFKPTTPIEIHFYSGEEAGLFGSEAIATSYSKAKRKVKAFMELDMTAYFKPGTTEVIAVESDYVDEDANAFAKDLIKTYSSLPSADDKACGYACSDHSSWFKYGYPTTMLYEAITGDDNPNIHGPNDTTSVKGFSWTHSLEFAKVALAFLYELSA